MHQTSAFSNTYLDPNDTKETRVILPQHKCVTCTQSCAVYWTSKTKARWLLGCVDALLLRIVMKKDFTSINKKKKYFSPSSCSWTLTFVSNYIMYWITSSDTSPGTGSIATLLHLCYIPKKRFSTANNERSIKMCSRSLHHWGFTCQAKPSCVKGEEALYGKRRDKTESKPKQAY